MRSATAVLPVLLGLALTLTIPVPSQGPVEQKLTASDAMQSDRFGASVAMDGDTAVIGANQTDDLGDATGSAYVFVRGAMGWVEQKKLTASDAQDRDLLGGAVAISGDTALVSAPGDDDGGLSSGAAYVFVRSGNTWTEQQKLVASDGDSFDAFGVSVALSGDTALVGAYTDEDKGGDAGSAYVFVRNGTTWTQQKKLTASDATNGDRFGISVALSGNTAVVGASRDAPMGDGSFDGLGAAYVFVRNGSTWTEQQKLTASDAAIADQLGVSVAVSGDRALVGAAENDDAGSFSGSAYVFVRNGTTWTEEDKLTASDAQEFDHFGSAVALSGDRAVVGAELEDEKGGSGGAAYVFTRSGSDWIEESKLTASDGATIDEFGARVAVSGETVLVASHGDDDAGSASGSAYVYEFVAAARADPFGAGCPGTAGTPLLAPSMGSLPKTGTMFSVVLSGLPANRPAYLVLGLSNTIWLSLPLPEPLAFLGAPGCSLLVSGDFNTGVVNMAGTATQGFPIPANPSLVGLHIYFQGYVLDPGANFFGVAVSNGLNIAIGPQ